PGALDIRHCDLKRLEPQQWLNDTLIEFGLTYNIILGSNGKDRLLADLVHIFSPFFYRQTQLREVIECGYRCVSSWTSKVDIFAKRYLIMPINENCHWYLAIIYEPHHVL
ncbi:hypothetical protein EDD16DRAFT_1425228, partial [Pisolithus croceorrhizus]